MCVQWVGEVCTVFAFEIFQDGLWLHIINTVHENMVYVGNIEVMVVSCVCQCRFGI